MKKLMSIFASALFVFTLSSCGGGDPTADAQAYADCLCKAQKGEAVIEDTKKCATQTAENLKTYADDAEALKTYTEKAVEFVAKGCGDKE